MNIQHQLEGQILPHSRSSQVQELPLGVLQSAALPIQSPSFWPQLGYLALHYGCHDCQCDTNFWTAGLVKPCPGNGLSVPLEGDRTPFPAGHQSADLTMGSPHSWENDCHCRPDSPTEWWLNQEITRHLFHLWGSPHMDLNATMWNT